MICAIFRREHAFKQGSSSSLLGTPGDVEPVGEGVSELRINYGPGYRVYFKKRGLELIILLAGGDKTTQAKDIKAALRLTRNLSE
ncbi:addiction module killer protein [mine drainage metagenome]|uniref:Addiction module killer protein n=1 Tax=mine drainage metagenome TaxID=410659 RepID=T0ZFA2_9ZZZZ